MGGNHLWHIAGQYSGRTGVVPGSLLTLLPHHRPGHLGEQLHQPVCSPTSVDSRWSQELLGQGACFVGSTCASPHTAALGAPAACSPAQQLRGFCSQILRQRGQGGHKVQGHLCMVIPESALLPVLQLRCRVDLGYQVCMGHGAWCGL